MANELDASRAGVVGQFGKAFADLARREQAANQAVNMLPQQNQRVFGDAQGALSEIGNAYAAAMRNAGGPNFFQPNTVMAPLSSVVRQNLASRQADVPLLRIGVQDAFARTRGALEAAQAEAAQEAARFSASMAAQRADNALGWARLREEQRQFNERDKPPSLIERAQKMAMEAALQRMFGPREESPEEQTRKAMRLQNQMDARDALRGVYSPSDTSWERGQAISTYGKNYYRDYDKVVREAKKAAERANEVVRKKLGGPLSWGPWGTKYYGSVRGYNSVINELVRHGKPRAAALLRFWAEPRKATEGE